MIYGTCLTCGATLPPPNAAAHTCSTDWTTWRNTGIEPLRARLRSNREAIKKVRDEMRHAYESDSKPGAIGVSRDWFPSWLAALDEVLKEEG